MKLSFAQWFKLRRSMAKVTQANIAKALKIRPQTVSNWEQGVSVPSLNPDQTLMLCLILKVSLENLAEAFRGEMLISHTHEGNLLASDSSCIEFHCARSGVRSAV